MPENYETTYILRGDLTEEGTKKITDKVTEIITRNGGKISSQKDLGKKPLAYRIARQMKGHYFEFDYQGTGPVIEDLERSLGLNEEVIRFLTVKVRKMRGARRAQ